MKMKAIGTVIQKLGKPLAIFQVKPELLDDPEATVQYRDQLRKSFTKIPIILICLKNGQIVFDGENTFIDLIQQDALDRYHWRGYDI